MNREKRMIVTKFFSKWFHHYSCTSSNHGLSIFIAWDYLALALQLINVSIWRVPSFNNRVQLGDGVCDQVEMQ